MKKGNFIQIALWALLMSSWAMAQEGVAFMTAIKGNVTVTDAKGKAKPATSSIKLLDGDKITTDAKGSVNIMYYTGKEIILGANKTHVVATKKEDNSFLSSLYGTLSGLMWGDASNSSMAGATRAWAGDANRSITAIYPSETKVLDTEPGFEWADHRATPGKDYTISLSSEISDFKYEINVSGVTQVTYPKTAPKLKNDEKYVWTVKDAKGTEVSPKAKFSLITPEDRELLDSDIKEVFKVCNNDNTNPQWYLLTAALYRDYGLMKQAESSIRSLIAVKPEMAQAHIMLATLYKETGRLEEAKAEEEIARNLSAAKK